MFLSLIAAHRQSLRRIACLTSLAAIIISGNTPRAGAAESSPSLQCKPYTVYLNGNGAVVRIEKQGATPTAAADAASSAGTFAYGTTSVALEKPVETKASDGGYTFTYQLATTPPMKVRLSLRLYQGKGNSVVVGRELTIECQEKLAADLTVKLPLWPALDDNAWLPLRNGTAGTLGKQSACVYRLAGTLPSDGVQLAIPMVSGSGGPISPRVTVATDPYFSTLFARDSVQWTYPKSVGLENNVEKRTVVSVFHAGTPEDAMQAFYDEALPDVQAGPQWLHDIAMVDYDQLSDQGKGWIADIDALAKAMPDRKDRNQVFLCLTDWFDWIGRYSFDVKTGKFDKEWIVRGEYERCKNAAIDCGILDGDRIGVNFAACRPTRLTLNQLHEMLRHAKSRGFRVGLYYADTLNSGTGLPDFNQHRVLKMGGWPGPEIAGSTYCLNPLVPEVRQFFLAYTDALLKEFDGEFDALVWDESSIGIGEVGPAQAPGYADRAMMRLAREVAKKVEDWNRLKNRQYALLMSDCIMPGSGAAPYALVAHGTYQDSWFQPQAWSYGIFPNYRNVMWSCCWWPVTKWRWIEFGVRNYQAPIAQTNGLGDDIGFSEHTPEMRQKVLDLFNWRKQTPTKLKYFDQLPTYVPKPVNTPAKP